MGQHRCSRQFWLQNHSWRKDRRLLSQRRPRSWYPCLLYTSQKRVAPRARIFETQVRDATVVRRAVTLGLPINRVGSTTEEPDSVAGDFMRVAKEIIAMGEQLD